MSFGKTSSLLRLGMIPLFVLPLSAQAIKIKNYTYAYRTEGTQKEIVLNVEQQDQRLEIIYYNEYGDKEVTVFDDKKRPLHATYYNPGREVTETSVYDYQRRTITLHGLVNARYALQEPVFDNNGSLFYLFSFYYPAPGRAITFHMVQSNVSRIEDPMLRMLITQIVGPVEMRLRHVGRETLHLAGQDISAEKYEFAINEGRMAMFWPHKYYFWYSSQDRKLLRHIGMSNEKKPNEYLLTDYFEWERPDPELPTL
ncbi:hypothetical protein JW933_04470 [candidate division FCPU426 bacterium]|nr:hypothetical protein [candidate division FCPU426 bacterium]